MKRDTLLLAKCSVSRNVLINEKGHPSLSQVPGFKECPNNERGHSSPAYVLNAKECPD